MKKFIYLILPALLIIGTTSCNKHENVEEGSVDFLFQKAMTIQDEDGNSADIVVHSNSEEILADYTEDVFYLETTTMTFPKSSNTENLNQEEIDDEDEIEEGEVFVMITNYSLDPSITGFAVRSKFESLVHNPNSTRATTSFTSFGADGTNGAYAAYTGQTCNAEYLNVKLKRKNCGICIWKTLASTSLYNVGDNWSWDSSTTYYKYKLKFISKNSCGGTIGIWYYWLT